jgi:serine/threonine-protein kinase RsbW
MTGPTNGSGGAVGTALTHGISYPAVGPAVSDARAHVTRWLRAGGEDELLIGDVAIAVTEACTNAVLHAYRDGADGNGDGPHFHVVTERADGVVTVTVSDSGIGMRPRPDSPGLGLGVSLMAALSDHVVMGTQPDGSGTVVAMSFTAAGSRSRLQGLD